MFFKSKKTDAARHAGPKPLGVADQMVALAPRALEPAPLASLQPALAEIVGANGTAPQTGPATSNLAQDRFAAQFAGVVFVLMSTPKYAHTTLSQLSALILPPLNAGQCAVLNAPVQGRSLPVAMALWASVSPEVDQRLAEGRGSVLQLRPQEWRSGDILWLAEAAGEAQAVQRLIAHLGETAWKGREVKAQGPAGGQAPAGAAMTQLAQP